MMRAMFAGVSGLKTHQVRMDVIGNNIANVNTYGFKASRVNFQDILSQTIRGATAPAGTQGGINPMQVGMGTKVGSIDTLFTEGNLQGTGYNLDLAIEGNGFFVLTDGANQYYTRAGYFDVDGSGNIVNRANGLKVMGWQADANGKITPNATGLSALQLPSGQMLEAKATDTITIAHNFNASLPADPSSTLVRSIEVYDSLGSKHTVVLRFEKTDLLEWTWTLESVDGDTALIDPAAPNGGVLEFTSTGQLSTTSVVGSFAFIPANGANPVHIIPDFSRVTHTAADGDSSMDIIAQNGYEAGVLETFSFNSDGVLVGHFSNGLRRDLGQVALANFTNPGGLVKAGDTLFEASNNSGTAQIGTAGNGGWGHIAPENLEMSNVNLAQEFTEMIITQRGFQANTRIISASDEMLQELVNLKR